MFQIPSVIFPHYLPSYWTNKKGEFKLAYQVLRILYRQSLIWVRKVGNISFFIYFPQDLGFLLVFSLRRLVTL